MSLLNPNKLQTRPESLIRHRILELFGRKIELFLFDFAEYELILTLKKQNGDLVHTTSVCIVFFILNPIPIPSQIQHFIL